MMSRAFFCWWFLLHSKWVHLKVGCLVTLTNEPYIHWGWEKKRILNAKEVTVSFPRLPFLKVVRVFGKWRELNVLFAIRHYYSLAGICCCFDIEFWNSLMSTLLIVWGIFVHTFLDKLCTIILFNKTKNLFFFLVWTQIWAESQSLIESQWCGQVFPKCNFFLEA